MKEEIKKGVPATATMIDGNVSTNRAAVVTNTPHANASNQRFIATPAETIAKIQKNLDFLYMDYQNPKKEVKGFRTDLSKALLLVQPEKEKDKNKDKDKKKDEEKKKKKERSNYGTFVLQNGTKITIRVSNHRANVFNFEKRKEFEALSIVIARRVGKLSEKPSRTHLVEYLYTEEALIANSMKLPLAQIAKSMKDVLLTGTYIDTTRLVTRREVNTENVIIQPVKIKKSHGPRL